MAETIQFRGAILRRFENPPSGETTPYVRSHWTVDFASPSNELMGWRDPGDCGVTGADLVGEIAAANVIVTPHDPQLEKHQIQFDCHEASDFQLHTVKDNGSSKREVRFIIRSNVRGVCALLEDYRWNVGDNPAIIRLSYARQEKMDLQEEKPPSQEQKVNEARAAHGPASDEELLAEFGPEDEGICVSCANRVPHEDEERTRHVTGQPCARHAGSTLASAAAAGGTHQRKRGRRSVEVPPEESDQDDSTVQ